MAGHQQTFSAEQINALVDGELDAAAAAQIAEAARADPALAEAIAAQRRLRARLAAHFAPLADAPIPERWTALIAAATPPPSADVVDLAAVRAAKDGQQAAVPRWRWQPLAGGAIAAAAAIAVLLVVVEGLAYGEAAAVIGCPIGTLTSRLVRGRAALLRELGEQ